MKRMDRMKEGDLRELGLACLSVRVEMHRREFAQPQHIAVGVSGGDKIIGTR